MPSWKKIIVSGSNASLNQISASGGFKGDGSAITNVSFDNISSKPTLFSGSAQFASDVSGSWQGFITGSGIVSSSVASSPSQGTIRIATNGVNTDVDSGLQTGDSPTFAGLTSTGNVVVQGTLTAETYVVSSSITTMSIAQSSGSTIFGDTPADDTHQFTGSLTVTSSALTIDSSGTVSGSSTSTGSFGAIEVGGGHFTSASLAAGGSGGGSGISNIVEDSSPQLGGDLDLNSNDVTGTGNINIVGNVSGSSTSTGSFGRVEAAGRVEAEHIHSTDDMTVADDLTVDGLIVASGDEIRGSYSLNKLTFPATQRAAINDVFFIHSSGGRGTLQLVGNTNRVGSNTLFGFSRDDINEFKSDHASITYTNFMVEADAIIAFPGSSGISQPQDLSIFKSNVKTTADHGVGRRLFLDFRRDDTAMFTADMSGSVYAFGNISGSSTSTGSFGVYGNDFIPSIDNTHDLGSSTHRWANAHIGDIELSNEGTEGNEVDGTTGSWTIQEGEDDLYLLNRKNGKKYKFKLEEIK